MAKFETPDSAPTMIIPAGTDIQVDVHGQLSVRTPGNLVIQNSGNYGTLESTGGSIRIEANAQVEAVKVSCAEGCYVQGSLTAWKVEARSIQLEESARANIVLQETDRLEVGREARLVGNFASEKELFLLFSRFAQQFRTLPLFQSARSAGAEEAEEEAAALPLAGEEADRLLTPPMAAAEDRKLRELPDPLFFALILLEREATRTTYGPTSQRVLGELVKLLQERDYETLRHTHETLFGRVVDPGTDVRRAAELIRGHFRGAPEAGEGREEGAAAADLS